MIGISDYPVPDSGFERPPLEIRHLILWTACSSVFLGIVTVLVPTTEWAPDNPLALSLALSSFSAGGGVFGLVLLRQPSFRRGRLTPGERLLRIIGVFYLGLLFSIFGDVLSLKGEHAGGSASHEFPIFVHLLVQMIALFLAIYVWVELVISAYRVRVWHWRILFIVLFVLPFVLPFVFFDFEYGMFVLLSGGGLIAVVFVALLDWHGPIRYPWTHWAGVICGGWECLTILVCNAIGWAS